VLLSVEGWGHVVGWCWVATMTDHVAAGTALAVAVASHLAIVAVLSAPRHPSCQLVRQAYRPGGEPRTLWVSLSYLGVFRVEVIPANFEGPLVVRLRLRGVARLEFKDSQEIEHGPDSRVVLAQEPFLDRQAPMEIAPGGGEVALLPFEGPDGRQ
jgi:hypothetical protein